MASTGRCKKDACNVSRGSEMIGDTRRLFCQAAIAASALLFFGSASVLAQPTTSKEPPVATTKESAPEDTCKACHEPHFNSYAASKHGTKADSRTPANRGGCFTCHGAGALEHAQKGGGKGV